MSPLPIIALIFFYHQVIKARRTLIHIELSHDNLKNYERMLSNRENKLNSSLPINKRVFSPTPIYQADRRSVSRAIFLFHYGTHMIYLLFVGFVP